MRWAISIVLIVTAALGCIEAYLLDSTEILIENPLAAPTILKISRKEARSLDRFFREILIVDSLAYTLTGDKPLSFACYQKPSFSFHSLMPPNIKISKGWETWKKYRNHFASSKILFWEEQSPWVNGVTCLILADRQQCKKCIEINLKDFSEILDLETENLFENVGKISFFKTSLKFHEALIGILLGFGRSNAWLYYNCHSSRNLPRVWDETLKEESSRLIKKHLTFQSIEMDDLALPRFVGDPFSEESQELMRNYMEAKERIKKFYSNRNFLSATLSLLKHGSTLLEI